MIDFTNCPTTLKTYGGANGNKISVKYNGEIYMLKFPSHPPKNPAQTYTNGCVSEYIGSNIFASVGISAQETILGTYKRRGKECLVVACKDFTSPGTILQDFASLKNSAIDTGHSGSGTELSEILDAINEQNFMDPVILLQHFWNMFIVDAWIGNWDRHNGNWGFLYDQNNETISLAPIFDCGSCLYPQADEKIMQSTLDDEKEMNFRLYEIPLSAIRIDGKKINYHDFITSLENKECNAALERIVPRLDLQKVSEIIEGTPCITDLQKEFYNRMLVNRKERILDKALELLQEKERKYYNFGEILEWASEIKRNDSSVPEINDDFELDR